MAVFTSVSLTELNVWIQQFPLGAARSIQGISSGIENSNFFIGTEAGEYVLTIFENLDFEQLPFYLHLMDHLARQGIPVPAPIANHAGQLMTPLHGKPAAIVSKLAGSSELAPTSHHCSAVGAMLAHMHLAGTSFGMHQENLRGLSWWRKTVPLVSPFLTSSQNQLLNAAMDEQEQFAASETARLLPLGPIHADLFRNNVMFDGDQLTGFFDFYFAGCDRFIFDLAVTCNDWCVNLDSGAPDAGREQTMLAAYQSVRPLEPAEQQAWPIMLRGAALRFWLSRLYDFHLPRPAQMLTPHDPSHFERILRMRS